MPKSTGLRTEVLTTVTLLMGAALLLGGVMMLRLTEQSLLEQKVEQLRLMTGTLANSLAEGVSRTSHKSDISFSSDVLYQLPESLRHQGWWLYGPDLGMQASYRVGDVASVTNARLQQARYATEAFESVRFPSLLEMFSSSQASSVQLTQPILYQNRFLGVLDINYSLEDVRYRLLKSQRMVLAYVLLYGSVLVAVGYYLLLRNVIKPARNLLRATEDVIEGNLETRLPVAGPVEISRLAEAYNNMVEALQQSRQETRQHIETLEHTNQQLQQTRDELIRSEKLASVGQLAAGLAHELGNPLAALIGYLEVLKSRVIDTEREVVTSSIVEAERIDFLVRELLDFARPADSADENIDPAIVMKDSITLLINQGSFSGIQVIDKLSSNFPEVRICKNKLQQVFINLFLNSIHALEGREDPTVKVEGGLGNNHIWLEIADNGCGIPLEKQADVFNPFFTTKPPGKGVGLGLAICYRIIKDAAGAIDFSSQDAEGTCFRIELPFVKEDP